MYIYTYILDVFIVGIVYHNDTIDKDVLFSKIPQIHIPIEERSALPRPNCGCLRCRHGHWSGRPGDLS